MNTKPNPQKPSLGAAGAMPWRMPLLCMARAVMVVTLSLVIMVMFKRLGMGNTWATLCTSLFVAPMALRGLLRPCVTAMGQRRWVAVGAQASFVVAMLMVAQMLGVSKPSMWACLVVASLSAAVHDVAAADLIAECRVAHRQSGSMACLAAVTLAIVLALGGPLIVGGDMEALSRLLVYSWRTALEVLVALMTAVAMACALAVRGGDEPHTKKALPEVWQQAMADRAQWWALSRRWPFVVFVFIVPWHEWMVWKGSFLFLGDPGSIGGLTLGPQEVGFTLGTLAVMALFAGAAIGNKLLQSGLRPWRWPMALAMTLPDALFLFLAYEMPSNLWLIALCLMAKGFLSGFGGIGFLTFVMRYGRGRGMAAHTDACTALLIASAVTAGAVTGVLQYYLGYRGFFIVASAAALATILLPMLPLYYKR